MLGVMVGVAAGALFAALAGARRTATAFDRFTEWGHAADLTVATEGPAEARALVELAGVADVAHLAVLNGQVFGIFDGRLGQIPTEVTIGVSDGRYLVDVERPRLAAGRFWEDGAAEAVVNPAFVARTGLDVGDRLEVVAFSHDVIPRFEGFEDLRAGFEADRSIGRVTEVAIVGRAVRAADAVRDSASAPGLFAVDRVTAAAILGTSIDGLAPLFDGGHLIAVVVEQGADAQSVGAAAPGDVTGLAELRADTDDAVRPFVMAVLLFAALGALGAVAAIGGSLARQAAADSKDAPLLVSLGADRRLLAVVAAGRAGVVGVVGVVVAVTVAVLLSPAFPLGPVADVEPHPGVAVDLMILVPGGVLLLAAVLTVGVAASRMPTAAPTRGATPGWISHRLMGALPTTGGIGVWMAFPPSGRARALMRATVVPVAVAALGGGAVAVFASSIDDLFEHPQRHGWNWDVAVTCNQGYCEIPTTFSAELDATTGVEAWTYLSFDTIEIGGQRVPTVGSGLGHGDLDPLTVIDGRPPATTDEVVLGESTMRQLGVRIGDRVTVDGAGSTMLVVGRAVFGGLGYADSDRPSLGRGAGMTAEGMLDLNDEPAPPAAVVLDVNGDPDPVADLLRKRMPQHTVLSTQRPSALAAWPDLRRLPLLLGVLLGLVGLSSLAHGVAASTRLHRRDLAVMRALGLTPRRVAYAVSWQTLALFTVALAIGAPLGILVGVTSWQAVTERLDLDSAAVAAPIPLVAGTLAAATAVAALAVLLARTTNRSPGAAALRSE
jgi:hypothetical protein